MDKLLSECAQILVGFWETFPIRVVKIIFVQFRLHCYNDLYEVRTDTNLRKEIQKSIRIFVIISIS